MLDILSEQKRDLTETDYLEVIEKKTAHLFMAAVQVGAIFGRSTAQEAIQAAIDVLHATGSLDYVKDKANQKLREGKSYLDNIELSEEGRDFFDGLVNFLEQRKI